MKLILNAAIAWFAGLVSIVVVLYFSNGGSDFTLTDVMGFGVMAIVASGVLMLAVYLPSLYWLKRRGNWSHPRNRFALLAGVVCNVPIFLLLAFLMKTKLPISEAVGFMLTFLIIGMTFGLGFTFATTKSN